jgi:hypothetical protein
MVAQVGSHTCMEKRTALLALHSEKIPNTYPVVGEETPPPPPQYEMRLALGILYFS